MSDDLRAKAARLHGLPEDVAALLTGDYPDALVAQAQRLASLRHPEPAAPPVVLPSRPRARLAPHTVHDDGSGLADLVAAIRARTF